MIALVLCCVCERKIRNLMWRMGKAAARGKFYAVRVGVRPGVYRSWNECSVNVTGFKGAQYK